MILKICSKFASLMFLIQIWQTNRESVNKCAAKFTSTHPTLIHGSSAVQVYYENDEWFMNLPCMLEGSG